MSEPAIDLSPEADALRAVERAALLAHAQAVARQAARAAGRKEDAEVSVNFVTFILEQAFAARDAELAQARRTARRAVSEPNG